mgnify:CR=1 FL=1
MLGFIRLFSVRSVFSVDSVDSVSTDVVVFKCKNSVEIQIKALK